MTYSNEWRTHESTQLSRWVWRTHTAQFNKFTTEPEARALHQEHSQINFQMPPYQISPYPPGSREKERSTEQSKVTTGKLSILRATIHL